MSNKENIQFHAYDSLILSNLIEIKRMDLNQRDPIQFEFKPK